MNRRKKGNIDLNLENEPKEIAKIFDGILIVSFGLGLVFLLNFIYALFANLVCKWQPN